MRGIGLIRLGQLASGRTDLLTALASHQETHNAQDEAMVSYNLATQLIEAGHTQDAEGHLARAANVWRQTGNKYMICDVHNSQALLHALRGNLSAALDEVKEALILAREIGHPTLECHALATLAEIYADEGSATEAERYAREAVELSARLDVADALNAALRADVGAALLRRDRAKARQLLDEARPLVLTAIDTALLDLNEGMLALRSRAFGRAVQTLSTTAECLEQLGRPHHAARAYLLYAEALLATGVSRRADDALNRMAELVLPLGCEGFLRPTARMARQVFSERHKLRRLRRETRLLLDRLAPHGRSLSLVVPATEDAPEPPTLCLSPFGQGHITLAGRHLDASLPPKARELLFYTVHAGRPVQRDELLESIWEDDQRAAQSLWDASRHLRRVLGEQAWGPRGGAYALHLPVQNEERAFEEAATTALGDGSAAERIAAAERALSLIGEGGYLEWCESLWASAARARLTQRATQVALALARLQAQAGACQEAIAACRRAIELDPLDEAPRRALLRQLAASGDVAAVRREYAAYRRLLHEELAVAPSAGLQRLARELHAVS
jgi:DNA-binding SARP family transcriptional activator